MRNRISNIIWGLLLIAVGIGFFGNVMDWWGFSLFFDGWWTLFIIIPCAVSMIQSGVHTSNVIGLAIGAVLLLNEQNILPVRLHQLILPVVLVAAGIAIVFHRSSSPKSYQTGSYQPGAQTYQTGAQAGQPGNTAEWQNYAQTGAHPAANAHPFSLFSSATSCFTGCPFFGGSCTTVFGGVKLDLRGAIITQDVSVEATAVFGGVDVLVDDRVQVRYSSLPILGGTDCKVGPRDPSLPTVFVNCVAVFGGVDIK